PAPSVAQRDAHDPAHHRGRRGAGYGWGPLLLGLRAGGPPPQPALGDITVAGNNSRVALMTSTAAVVLCETFGVPDVKAGDAISVLVRASDALRDDAGVLLRSCEIAAP